MASGVTQLRDAAGVARIHDSEDVATDVATTLDVINAVYPLPRQRRVARRGRRGRGVPIIPSRVREARAERGLSLAGLAGNEVSRAFIHQLEQGLARPSAQVLEMIARRTGKSVSFFTSGTETAQSARSDIVADLLAMSKRLERLAVSLELTEVGREAFRIVINNMRHGARLIAATQAEGHSGHDQPNGHTDTGDPASE